VENNLKRFDMPDISLCKNENCLQKKTCYRFTAVPSRYQQVYGDFKPDETGKCEYHIYKPKKEEQ
jgi:hypothetical protein